MKITNCKVNHLYDPIGYRLDHTVFSWIVEDALGSCQEAAQIQIAADSRMDKILADTGLTKRLDSLGTEVQITLQPRTRYYWRVRVQSDAGEDAWSEVHFFETGKMSEDWKGQWLTCDSKTERHPVFHGRIPLRCEMPEEGIGAAAAGNVDARVSTEQKAGAGQPVKEQAPLEMISARLYICGLGLYEASIGGIPVSKEKLTPYSTDYKRWIEAQTFDVTSQLRQIVKEQRRRFADGNDCFEKEKKAGMPAWTTAFEKCGLISASLDVELGNGWYKGRFGYSSKVGDPGYYGDSWKLIAELHVQYTDGREEVFGTDENWTVTRSAIVFSNLYDGEYRDDTLLLSLSKENRQEEAGRGGNEENHVTAGAGRNDKRSMATGNVTEVTAEEKVRVLGTARKLRKTLPLSDRLSLPVLEQEKIRSIALLDTPKDEKVYDLGQNFAGGFTFHVPVLPVGSQIHLQFGEVLQEGSFYRENLRTALAEYWYVTDGTEKVIAPRFTYYGYRYAKVEFLPPIPERSEDLDPAGILRGEELIRTAWEALSVEDFTGVAWYSDVENVGSLTTGHEKINQLISNIRWGQKSNFVDVPTDCPQRDEKMGWTADTQVFVPTASFFTDSTAFYRKYLQDLRLEQEDLGGMVPDTVPSFGLPGQGAAVWSDAVTIIPWTLYQYTGDLSILRENYHAMTDWVNWVERIDEETRAWGRHFQFGDWLALDHPSGKADEVKGGTEDAFIAYVYYYNSLCITAKTAALLGEDAEAAEWTKKSRALYAYLQDEYFTRNGRLAITTQTGYVLALYYGLAEHPEVIRKSLVKLLHARGDKLATGFVGTGLILKTLSQAGEDALAYRILLNEEYPGWLNEIGLGATTVWERWNSMGGDGKVSSTGMNSFNHYAYGAVGEWMWRTIGGIVPDVDKPGFCQVILRPIPHRQLHHAAAKYRSAAGTFETSWEILDGSHVKLTATVPFGAKATLQLPWAAELRLDGSSPDTPEAVSAETASDKAASEIEQELVPGQYVWIVTSKVSFEKNLHITESVEKLLADPDAGEILQQVIPQIGQFPADIMGLPLTDAMEEFQPGNEAMRAKLREIKRRFETL